MAGGVKRNEKEEDEGDREVLLVCTIVDGVRIQHRRSGSACCRLTGPARRRSSGSLRRAGGAAATDRRLTSSGPFRWCTPLQASGWSDTLLGPLALRSSWQSRVFFICNNRRSSYRRRTAQSSHRIWRDCSVPGRATRSTAADSPGRRSGPAADTGRADLTSSKTVRHPQTPCFF